MRPRISVLFSRLSGYMSACLKTLEARYDVALQVISYPPASNAPFDAEQFSWIDRSFNRADLSADQVLEVVDRFDPVAIFMVGWADAGYLRVARKMRKRGVPVVAGSDAQWEGSLRQHLGRIAAPWYLHSAIDVLWAAGERQRQFAARLGFRGERCWSGYYTCDWDRFAAAYSEHNPVDRPRHFLYVGRYASVKGLDVLVEAYQQYRSAVDEPWPVTSVGAGEFSGLLDATPGIENRGFIQPDELPGLMAEASAFILPSRREPWGVVVQEAAATGLPLICSDACGAAVHLLQDGFNGYLFESANPRHLAACMIKMSKASAEELRELGERSHMLSRQFTPARWAETFMDGLSDMGAISTIAEADSTARTHATT